MKHCALPARLVPHDTVSCSLVRCRVNLAHERSDLFVHERAFVGVSSGEVAAADEAPVEAQAIPQGGWGVQGGPRVQEHADRHVLDGCRVVEVDYIPHLHPLPNLSQPWGHLPFHACSERDSCRLQAISEHNPLCNCASDPAYSSFASILRPFPC